MKFNFVNTMDMVASMTTEQLVKLYNDMNRLDQYIVKNEETDNYEIRDTNEDGDVIEEIEGLQANKEFRRWIEEEASDIIDAMVKVSDTNMVKQDIVEITLQNK